MKRNLLFLLILSAFIATPAIAAVTLEESTDAEYMINAGYSQSMAEDTFIMKNRVNSKPIEPLYERNQNGLVKTFKKFYAYLDPGIESVDRLHHDIKLSPSISDL